MLPRLASVFAVAALLAGCGSSGSTPLPSHHSKARRTYSSRRASTLVRNATPQPDWRPYTGPVPILVYHDLGTPPPTEPYSGLFMSYANFETEMAWLHTQGYQAVTLDEVMKAWFHGGTLPAKPIVITFDNGYIPQVTFAPQVMSKYGWPAVLNEITANHLDDARIESVLKLGWEVDSHSVYHTDLTTDDPATLHTEVFASRTFLRDTFHIPANGFCYPSSKYNATVLAAVRAAGYEDATTEGNAYATRADPFLLPRFEMETGLPELEADLANHAVGP